jgi:hypothetical protein
MDNARSSPLDRDNKAYDGVRHQTVATVTYSESQQGFNGT